MEKKVTREEVERALDKHCMKEEILNELFPPEFKVGDWVTVDSREMYDKNRMFNFHSTDFKGKDTFKIGSVHRDYVCQTDDDEGNGVKNTRLRQATPEEIAASEWEPNKPYKVFGNEEVVRISAEKVGHFYANGRFEGNDYEWKKYEKIKL